MKRRLLQSSLALLTLTLLICAGWGAHRWWTYPKYPDVNKADLRDVWRFMASDDFRRLSRSHQQRYAMADIQRIRRELKFPGIIRLMTSGGYDERRLIDNLRQLPDFEGFEAAWVQCFLDEFFEVDPDKRTIYLMVVARLQQTEMAQHPERFGMPSATELKNNMSVFFARQPPRTQGQMGRFLRDLRQTR